MTKNKAKAHHHLRGNPSNKDLGTLASFDPTTDKPASWLDRIGKTYWRRIAPQLKRNGLLRDADREALAFLCQAYSEYRHCVEVLRKDGRVTSTSGGGLKAHPLVGQQRTAWDQFSKLCKEFGLTPASRNAVDATGDTDELDDFLEGVA